MVEIDQHHHAGLGGDAGQSDEADRHRHRHVEPEPPHQPQPADQRERQRQHDDQRFGEAPEVEVEQQEDDHQRHRHHDLQPGLGAFEIFELAAPHEIGAGRHLHLLVRPPSAHRRRSRRDRGRGCRRRCRSRAWRSRCGCWWRPGVSLMSATSPSGTVPPFGKRHQHVLGDRLRIGAQIARIADRDRVAFASLDRGGDRLGAKRRRDHVLHVGDHQTVARQLVAVGDDLEVVAADNALGVGAGGAGDGLERRFRPGGRPVSISARSLPITLTPTGVRMPVDSMSMRALIGIVQALETPGNCSARVHLLR